MGTSAKTCVSQDAAAKTALKNLNTKPCFFAGNSPQRTLSRKPVHHDSGIFYRTGASCRGRMENSEERDLVMHGDGTDGVAASNISGYFSE